MDVEEKEGRRRGKEKKGRERMQYLMKETENMSLLTQSFMSSTGSPAERRRRRGQGEEKERIGGGMEGGGGGGG